MPTEETTNTHTLDNSPDSVEKQSQAPYEGIVSQVVARIRNEPFLFVIAIAALLIGLAVLAAGLGSPDLRFIVVVVAVLAFLVILGYYLLAVLQIRVNTQPALPKEPESAHAAIQDRVLPEVEAQPAASKQAATAGSEAGKFAIDARGATIGAIGDETKVDQHIEKASGKTGGDRLVETGESPPTAAGASKFQIHAPGSDIGAIGDGAEVKQRISGSAPPSEPGAHSVAGVSRTEHRETLKAELGQHQRNLARLKAQKAVYASGEEPLRLLNQIEHEEREVKRIEGELATLQGDEG